MSQTPFRWDKGIPAEVLPALRQVLEPLAWLVPGWCQRVYVYWHDKDVANEHENGITISTSCHYDYRYTTLNFYPSFLAQSEEEKREMAMHDLLHAFSSVLAGFASDAIERLLPKDDAPKYREQVLEELRIRHESWTQDLAHCLFQKLSEPEPPAPRGSTQAAWRCSRCGKDCEDERDGACTGEPDGPKRGPYRCYESINGKRCTGLILPVSELESPDGPAS